MANKNIPIEALIILQNQLDALPARSPKRRFLTEETATMYDISISTLRRLLRQHHQPSLVNRIDYNQPGIASRTALFCIVVTIQTPAHRHTAAQSSLIM